MMRKDDRAARKPAGCGDPSLIRPVCPFQYLPQSRGGILLPNRRSGSRWPLVLQRLQIFVDLEQIRIERCEFQCLLDLGTCLAAVSESGEAFRDAHIGVISHGRRSCAVRNKAKRAESLRGRAAWQPCR